MVVRNRALKVARPWSARTAVLPPRMEAPKLLPRAMVTSELSEVTTLPYWSSTRTMTAGVISWPGTTVLGWVANANWVAGPGTALAVNVTELVPGMEAVRVLLPATVPIFQEARVAMPRESVRAVRVAEPPPEATAKVTMPPGTGLPRASLT